MKVIKSPLRYPGGKSRAIKQIAPLIPDFQEFREPFVGGGSVFVHCRQQFPMAQYWVNDLHPTLFQFWKNAQQNLPLLIQYVKKWKTQYTDGKVLHRFLLDNMTVFDEVEKGAAFFVLNRLTFSGTSESGGYSKQAFEKRFTDSSIERVIRFAPLLADIKITNLDYEDLVKADGEKVFLFLDPPYHAATKSALYGKNGRLHKSFDHERFADNMRHCQHKWLITYDDSPYIRELFDFAEIIPWNLTYGMRNVVANSNQKGKEIFIKNY
jgi:DNA adenine methylase